MSQYGAPCDFRFGLTLLCARLGIREVSITGEEASKIYHGESIDPEQILVVHVSSSLDKFSILKRLSLPHTMQKFNIYCSVRSIEESNHGIDFLFDLDMDTETDIVFHIYVHFKTPVDLSPPLLNMEMQKMIYTSTTSYNRTIMYSYIFHLTKYCIRIGVPRDLIKMITLYCWADPQPKYWTYRFTDVPIEPGPLKRLKN